MTRHIFPICRSSAHLRSARLDRCEATRCATRWVDLPGHAVETGLAHLFRGGSIGEAQSAALDRFEENTAGEAAEIEQTERSLIIPMLDTAATWEAPAKLAATQLRVEHWFSGVPVPIIG